MKAYKLKLKYFIPGNAALVFNISIDSAGLQQGSAGWSQFGSQPKNREKLTATQAWGLPETTLLNCQQSWLSVNETGSDSTGISLTLTLCLTHPMQCIYTVQELISLTSLSRKTEWDCFRLVLSLFGTQDTLAGNCYFCHDFVNKK